MPRTVTYAIAGLTFGACMYASGCRRRLVGRQADRQRRGGRSCVIRCTSAAHARLYAILPAEPADGMSAPRAVHLVPRSEIRPGSRHWLHYTQHTCRWDVRVAAWADLVIGDRMAVSLPDASWADDATDDAAEPGAPTALDSQLLEIASAPELIALFDANPRDAHHRAACAADAGSGDGLLHAADGERRQRRGWQCRPWWRRWTTAIASWT